MTSQEFIEKLERTYGEQPYKPELRQIVTAWARQWSPRARRVFYSELLKEFSWRWGKLPSIAELEEARKSALANRADELDEPSEQRLRIEGDVEEPADPATAADFMRDLLRGMRQGKHPRDVLADYELADLQGGDGD